MSEQITVLMPTYNREKYVAQAIKSILEQTYSNLILQIYDDGSTDKTIDIIKSFEDSRIKLKIGDKNKGVSFARNQLLDLCETKYAAWQDSDDISNIHRLEYQFKEIEKGFDIVFTRFSKLVSTTKNNELPIQYDKTGVNASALFIVDKNIRFDETLEIGEDSDWVGKMNRIYKNIAVNYILYYIRFHNDRLSRRCRK